MLDASQFWTTLEKYDVPERLLGGWIQSATFRLKKEQTYHISMTSISGKYDSQKISRCLCVWHVLLSILGKKFGYNPWFHDICVPLDIYEERVRGQDVPPSIYNPVLGVPSLKLTNRTRKWMVGIRVSFWDGLFSGAMLVSGRVIFTFYCKSLHLCSTLEPFHFWFVMI